MTTAGIYKGLYTVLVLVCSIISLHAIHIMFFRNNQVELACEAKVADYNAQSVTNKVCMSHNAALDMLSV